MDVAPYCPVVKLSRGGWLAVGLVAGGLLSPAAVYAAATVVNIAGPSGRVAEVAGTNQLQVVESGPGVYFESGYPALTTGSCTVVAKPPSGRAFIVTQLSVVTLASPTFDRSHGIVMFRNATCAGAATFVDLPTHLGESAHDFHPGIPTKTGISILAFGTGYQAEAEVRGYTVAATAVP
jgi:hypothetical protein